jgi:hypothetical protein
MCKYGSTGPVHDNVVGQQCNWLHCSIVILIPGVLSTWRRARWAICCQDILMSILPFYGF